MKLFNGGKEIVVGLCYQEVLKMRIQLQLFVNIFNL